MGDHAANVPPAALPFPRALMRFPRSALLNSAEDQAGREHMISPVPWVDCTDIDGRRRATLKVVPKFRARVRPKWPPSLIGDTALAINVCVWLMFVIGWTTRVPLWALVPLMAAAAAFSFRLLKKHPPLLEAELRAAEDQPPMLTLGRSGVRLPMSQIRGFQVLRGGIDAGNYRVLQITLLIEADGSWERLLVEARADNSAADWARATSELGQILGIPTEFYNMRGWKTPTKEVISPLAWKVGKAYREPLGIPPDFAAWYASGRKKYDASAERLPITDAKRATCRVCEYSLAGLGDRSICPECGTDFGKNPSASD